MTDNRATDELRRLLDERGVEWEGTPGVTFWGNCSALDITTNEKGKVHLHLCCTPEQAIAATLGRGTCEIETTENWLPAERYHRCKHCGAFFAVMDASGDIPPCVCPNCGKVVER